MSEVGDCSGSVSNSVSRVLIEYIKDACTEEVGFSPILSTTCKTICLKNVNAQNQCCYFLFSSRSGVFGTGDISISP